MDDQTFDDIFASLVTPAVEEAATDAAAPEDDELPSDQVSEDEDVADGADAPEAAVAAQPQTPPVANEIDWNRPELQPLVRQAQAFALVQQAVQQQQQQKRAQEFQQGIAELADGDPERQQKIGWMLDQVVAPLRQEVQQRTQEATYGAKLAAAFHMALRAHFDDDTANAIQSRASELMQFDGPQVMERMALSGKQQSQREQALAAENAELKRKLAASQTVQTRRQAGADLVDGGGGSAPLDLKTRLAQPESTLDDVFDAMGIGRERRTA